MALLRWLALGLAPWQSPAHSFTRWLSLTRHALSAGRSVRSSAHPLLPGPLTIAPLIPTRLGASLHSASLPRSLRWTLRSRWAL